MKEKFRSLNLVNDKYDGITIDGSSISENLEEFEKDLVYLIKHLQNKKLLWIKLDIENSKYIPLLTSYDFVFHHCNERDITLVKRLSQNPVIPTATNHTLGVGAVVIEGEKLLVVKDRIWQTYKLPGGHIDDRENISNALKREVFEETGIDVEFDSIVSLGHFIPGQFNESNLYVICRAKTLSNEINIQDCEEIIEAKWIDIDEYLNHDEVLPYNKKIVQTALKNNGLKLEGSTELIMRKDLSYEIFL
jgi:8-oxo-dGTP diphosphatase